MKKKILSVALAAALTLSTAAVAAVSASAALDADGRYVPSEGTETQRLYFYMPDDWYNTKYGADTAGCYWWGGTDAGQEFGAEEGGNAWPGYKAQVWSEEEGVSNVYYIDLPTDVETVVWNNFLDGGTGEKDASGNMVYQYSEERYYAAKQSMNVMTNYYSEGDNDFYDSLLDGDFFTIAEEALENGDESFLGDFADNFFIEPEWGISLNFQNMIFVIDPSSTIENELNGKLTYCGEWYFYYGDGEYGALPNKTMAEENNLVYSLKDYSSNVTPSTPSSDNNNNNNNNGTSDKTQPTTVAPSKDAQSSTSDTAKNNANNTNGAIQTGSASMATVVLLLVIGAAGVTVFARKKFFG